MRVAALRRGWCAASAWGSARTAGLRQDAAPEGDSHCMSSRAGLQLCEQVPYVRLHRLLRQEETLPDVAVHETVGDELKDLDLTRGRLLLELANGRGEGDDLRAGAGSTGRHLFEATGVIHVPAQNLLAFSSVHDVRIGAANGPLDARTPRSVRSNGGTSTPPEGGMSAGRSPS